MYPRLVAGAAFAASALFTSLAVAQPSPPSPGGADAPRGVPVVPPILRASTEAVYPAGAHGDAVVVLELLINVAGHVDDVTVRSGDEPFAEAAVIAARTFEFDPARRDTRPVAARVRFEVRFDEPPAPPPEAPAGTETAPAAATPSTQKAAPKPALVEEVRVTGNRAPPGAVTLGRAEVRQLPGAFGDPFRALDALPGVTPIISGLPFFYVRGAPPGNVGYFLEGIKVPYIFHAGFGPSVIHPGMVDSVTLHPGGYPAEFGHFAGGIVSASTTDPRPELHGEGNIRLFDAGAIAETGFDGGRGTALVGGRYSYTAALVSLFAPDTRLDYHDFQGRVTYDVTPKDRLTFFGFGAYDLVAQTTNGIESVLFGAEFYRADLRWDHKVDADTTVRLAVTTGFDQTHIPGQPRNSRSTQGAVRAVVAHSFSDTVTLRVGADSIIENFTADAEPYADPDDPTTQRFNALFPARLDTTTGVWGELSFRLGKIWQLTPGIRTDLYTSAGDKAVGVDPRLGSRIDVTPKIHVIHALGIAHQPPSFLIPVPGLAIGKLSGGLQTAYQASGGVEVDFPQQITASVTAFDNVFRNMSDTLGVSRDPTDDPGFQEPRSLGSAVGAEVYIRKRLTSRIGGYVTYTLSRSTRSVGTEHFLSTFDRPHVANAALSFDLGRNWRAGTRFTIYSGTPIVPPGGNGLIAPPRSLDPARDPTFYRIDFRLEKRWYISKPRNWWLAFVAEMMNATLHKETLQGQVIGPVSIPSVGVEAGL